MMAPYLLRLLCLCLASFFVIHAGAGFVVKAMTRFILRALETTSARRAARLLLTVRLLPLMLAAFVVGTVCVPSYLILEEEASAEHVGAFCLVLASLSLGLWLVSVARTARAVSLSRRHRRDWERAGFSGSFGQSPLPVFVVESETPLLAVAGVFHPRLVISRGVTAVLSLEQLDAALRHEEVHRRRRDNVKRLLLLLTPGLFPGWNGFHALEHAWLRFTEWAADDEAVAGNSRLSVSLAEALVRIARLGGTPAPTPLNATFLVDGCELSARVDRLLRPANAIPAPGQIPVVAGATMLAASAFIVFVALRPVTLSSAHWLLERLIH